MLLFAAENWNGSNCRLEISYDETSDCFRVKQPVEVQPDYVEQLRQVEFPSHTPSENAESEDRVAAIDVGANNTLTIITDTGDARIYHARPQFHHFQANYEHIATLQSHLPPDTYSSRRIRRKYGETYGQRDHHRDAAIKSAMQWLRSEGVDTVYVGDLSDVLDTHWCAEVNTKTHNYWSHGQVTEKLDETGTLAGVNVEEVSEAGTSSQCPCCGSDDVCRDGDELSCRECSVESHADIVGAALILEGEADVAVSEWFESESVRPMARPAPRRAERCRDGDQYTVTYLQWDDHEWTPLLSESVGTLGSFDQRGVSKPASSKEATAGCVANEGIPRL